MSNETYQPHTFKKIEPIDRDCIKSGIVHQSKPLPQAYAKLDLGQFIQLDPNIVDQDGYQSQAVKECRKIMIQRLHGRTREKGRELRRFAVEQLAWQIGFGDFERLSQLIDGIERAGDELR